MLRLHGWGPDGDRVSASVHPQGTGCAITPVLDADAWLAEGGSPVSLSEPSAHTSSRTVLGGEWVEREVNHVRRTVAQFMPLLLLFGPVALSVLLSCARSPSLLS